jgi:uncharacterized protein
MEIAGDYTFDIPQDVVWEALQDPNVLGAVVPGGQGFTQVGENQYTGNLQIKVGPVQGTFEGKINLRDILPPQSYTIEVDGKGAPGFVKATGAMQLEARGAAQTFMTYSGQAQVGGRIASVGQRLMESAARSIIRQSLDALNEYLKVKVVSQPAPAAEPVATTVVSTASMETATEPTAPEMPAAPAPTPTPPAYKPPSQLQLGLNVARDVVGDFIPPKYQPLALGALIVVVLLIIVLLSRP